MTTPIYLYSRRSLPRGIYIDLVGNQTALATGTPLNRSGARLRLTARAAALQRGPAHIIAGAGACRKPDKCRCRRRRTALSASAVLRGRPSCAAAIDAAFVFLVSAPKDTLELSYCRAGKR